MQFSLNHTLFSKSLSYTLRHGAMAENIPIRSDGYILLSNLRLHKKYSHKTLADFQTLVENDKKSRYNLSIQDGEWMIRANQGHSINVTIEMKQLFLYELLNIVHGTFTKNIAGIIQNGLSRMSRIHIHFSNGGSSGFRENSQAFVYIDVELAIKDGMLFYSSENGVVLTQGFNGIIPVQYLLNIFDKDGSMIWSRDDHH